MCGMARFAIVIHFTEWGMVNEEQCSVKITIWPLV
jgi:hypothetical protein